jgi:hypothetical protein
LNKQDLDGAEDGIPQLLIPEDKDFLFVEKVTMPADIDHAVIGLIDPAHVTLFISRGIGVQQQG